jgi:hypothetical protein
VPLHAKDPLELRFAVPRRVGCVASSPSHRTDRAEGAS